MGWGKVVPFKVSPGIEIAYSERREEALEDWKWANEPPKNTAMQTFSFTAFLLTILSGFPGLLFGAF